MSLMECFGASHYYVILSRLNTIQLQSFSGLLSILLEFKKKFFQFYFSLHFDQLYSYFSLYSTFYGRPVE